MLLVGDGSLQRWSLGEVLGHFGYVLETDGGVVGSSLFLS